MCISKNGAPTPNHWCSSPNNKPCIGWNFHIKSWDEWNINSWDTCWMSLDGGCWVSKRFMVKQLNIIMSLRRIWIEFIYSYIYIIYIYICMYVWNISDTYIKQISNISQEYIKQFALIMIMFPYPPWFLAADHSHCQENRPQRPGSVLGLPRRWARWSLASWVGCQGGDFHWDSHKMVIWLYLNGEKSELWDKPRLMRWFAWWIEF